MNYRLVCCRALDSDQVVDGTVFTYKCHTCGTNVGVSPSGQRVLSEHPDSEIICNQCMSRRPISPDDKIRPAPGSLEEFVRTVLKDRGRETD